MLDMNERIDTEIRVRRAGADDSELLAELGAHTFHAAYAENTRPESLAAFIESAFGASHQAAELSEPGVVFFIAEVRGMAVGYVKLQAGVSVPGISAVNPMELGRIYTSPEWYGRGIGTRLMQTCIDEARQNGHDVLWLGVWEHNPRARVFYRKWGFVEVGAHRFFLGDEPQTDILMQRALNA
jgi:diamine N-acetyltransferase